MAANTHRQRGPALPAAHQPASMKPRTPENDRVGASMGAFCGGHTMWGLHLLSRKRGKMANPKKMRQTHN